MSMSPLFIKYISAPSKLYNNKKPAISVVPAPQSSVDLPDFMKKHMANKQAQLTKAETAPSTGMTFSQILAEANRITNQSNNKGAN